MLTPERIKELSEQHLDASYQFGRLWIEGEEEFASAIEAEVRKDYESLIRQMLEAAIAIYPHLNGLAVASDEALSLLQQQISVIAAARARLIDSDLSKLTERGAKAWAGVDPQKLREGKAL